MTIHDLIFKSGSFLDKEYKKNTYLERADLIRVNDDNITKSIISFNLEELLESPESKSNLVLKPNDLIRVYGKSSFNSNYTVSINGNVKKPGVYSLKKDMDLKDLILEAGGLNNNIYNYRVEVARLDPSNTNLNKYAEVITFNIDQNFKIISKFDQSFQKELLSDDNSYLLKPHDLITLRSNPYFDSQKLVKVSGEVLYPGDYTILTSHEKITDIISRAGGLKPNAYLSASQYFRKGIRIKASFEKNYKKSKIKTKF